MDTLIILMGVLGFGAIIIAVHVLSADSGALVGEFPTDGDDGLDERKGGDRRSGIEVSFPLLIHDNVVHEDRRTMPDRRQAAA